MHGKSEENFIVLKLDDGEDLFDCLERAVADYGIKSAMIVSGIGMLADFELGFFRDGEYEWVFYDMPHELVAMHGSISTLGGIVIHIHAGLADSNHRLVGGHLKSAKVRVLNEILLLKLDNMEFERVLNPSTGLKELKIS